MTKRPNYGPAVENGIVRYFSPSALTAADPNQYGGCNLRYWYKYRDHRPEPFTASQQKGDEMHAQIENYLKTGERLLGPLAMSGFGFVPPPMSPRYEIEFELITDSEPRGDYREITIAPLTAAGRPVVGYGDLLERDAPTYIDDSGEARSNPARTLEVTDWKSTSRETNMKAGPALRETVQMIAYAEWAARTGGDVEHARLSHVYFLTSGKPRAFKRTTIIPRDDVARRWELIEGLARTVIDVAAEPDPLKVEGNPQACDAWRGCPHASYCVAKKRPDIFGPALAKDLQMSVLGKLNLPGLSTPAPAAPSVNLDLAAAVAALKQKEQAELAARTKPAEPAPSIPAGFADAIAVLEKSGMGMPSLSFDAAAPYAALKGIQLTQGAGLAGSGTLSQVALTEAFQVVPVSYTHLTLPTKRIV